VDPGAADGDARNGARRMRRRLLLSLLAALLAREVIASAHSGPPFPIVSDRVAGAYRLSIWTDPDTTDDGTAAGQFWVTLDPANGTGEVPAGTHATVAIRPLDRDGPTRTGQATPVNGSIERQFIALLMDLPSIAALKEIVQDFIEKVER